MKQELHQSHPDAQSFMVLFHDVDKGRIVSEVKVTIPKTMECYMPGLCQEYALRGC
jgi:hypothetical protein